MGNELPEDIWILIANNLTGEASIQQQADFADWLNADIKNKSLYEEIKQIWMKKPVYFNENQAFDRLSFRIEKDDIQSNQSTEKSAKVIKMTTRSLWAGVAACVLLLIAVWVFRAIPQSTPQSEAVLTMQHNPKGKMTQITLTDDTKIWLNANSHIRYPKKFTGDSREIYLTGEAFFEVARNEQKPFIIHTPNTKVRVLGTSFNIRAFSDESITETVVMTGKVSVADTKNTKNVATLLPNQKATLIAGQPKFDLQNVEAKRYTQWKDGILQFDNENLNTVLKTLSNHYGYDFYPENPNLFNCRLTAKFENKPIDKILKYLELALKISYQIESKKIILKGSGC